MNAISLRRAMSASVVVCCHDEGRFAALQEAVDSVLAQRRAEDEIVVVVDHNEALLARTAEIYPQLQVIANLGPRGLSGARNTGVAQSSGDLVVFLDDDAVADPGMLKAMKALAAPDSVLGIAGLVEPDWLGGRPAWFPSEMLWTVGCTYEGMRPGPVRNAIGALMAIKRSVLDATGAFRVELGRGASKLPLGCEETELCMRAGRRFPERSFVYATDASCAHKVPPSRATWRYLVTRCWAEGFSKATLRAHPATRGGLATERDYTLKILPRAVVKGLFDVCRGDPNGLLRAVAVVLGFVSTATAYAIGRLRNTAPVRRVATILGAATGHAALLANAGALAVGTLTSAVLGFAYWWVAARGFTPRAVGLASAAISVMNLLAHIGEFGLGPLLLGYLPRYRSTAPDMLSTALVGVIASCLLVGLAAVGLDAVFHLGLGSVTRSLAASLFFVFGVVTTGASLVLDQAFVGLLRSTTQMWRNVLFAGLKLAMLGALAVFATGADELWIFATWIISQAVSLAVMMRPGGRRERFWRRPRAALLRPLVGDVLAHHALNIVLQTPALVMPFLVTVVLSAETNAAFFAAWSLINVALLVPASLTTVLYSTGARDPHLMAQRLRMSLALSAALGIGTGLGLLFFSSFVLGLFSPAYPLIAGAGLKVLGFGVFAVAMKYHYVALKRFAGRMVEASAILAIGGAVEIAAAAIGGHLGGLTGLTEGWVAGVCLEAAVLAPAVLAATRARVAAPSVVLPRSGELETV